MDNPGYHSEKYFSQRLAWHEQPNAWSQAVAQARQEGRLLWDLTQSNPTQAHVFSPELEQTVRDAWAQTHPIAYQPDPLGDSRLRQAIAEYHHLQGVSVEASDVVVCASTSEAYAWLFELLCDPGERVYTPTPSYPLFEQLARLCGVQTAPYLCWYDGSLWRVNRQNLQDLSSSKGKALVVVHPNNPTGHYVEEEDMKWLFSWCASQPIPLIADEVFFDHPLQSNQGFRSFGAFQENKNVLCFVLSGLSKVLGLPQAKLSWILVLGPEPLRTQAQRQLEWIADAFLSTGPAVQQAAAQLLPQAPLFQLPLRERMRKNHHFLTQAVLDTPVQLMPAQGGWSVVLQLPRFKTDEEWALLLLQEVGVVAYPGYFFDISEESCLVVGLLLPPEVFAEAVRRLVHRVNVVSEE